MPYSARKLLPFFAALAAVVIGYNANSWSVALRSNGSATPQPVSSSLGKNPTPANLLTGRATVIDGDTIEISGQRIRFNGIDAPEGKQSCRNGNGKPYACGRAAASALDEFLAASRPVKCTFVEWDQYGRYVGNCVRSDGRSVQEWLVENGHALDWPRYSNGAFAVQQTLAQEAGRGVWRGEFQRPWDWRAAHRVQQSAPAASQNPSFTFIGSSGCNIKGNISAEGERIYHVPGQQHYERTRISEEKGERWFCSEVEAAHAGWRRAKR